ncbi:hypothetical protein ATCC90586_000718 [Pythium insidiosum]|nr:hypothetical protein ATCC90586_000718 [Pythium insidiosum]
MADDDVSQQQRQVLRVRKGSDLAVYGNESAPASSNYQNRKWSMEETVDVDDENEDQWTSNPHTLTGGFVLMTWIVYAAFHDPSTSSDDDSYADGLKSGMKYACVFFLTYCALQLPDGHFIRPHPMVWRVLTGAFILYEMLLIVLLFLRTPDARAFLKIFDPKLGVELPEVSYASDCRLYTPENPESSFINFRNTFFDRFVIMHFVGWFVGALMMRSYIVCWILSVMFEWYEISFRHWLPNFNECWWDHLFLDIFTCNAFGIYLGMKVCRWFEMKKFNWVGIRKIPNLSGKAKRALAQFTPAYWLAYNWKIFTSFDRFWRVMSMVIILSVMMLNSFFLKTVLWVPASSTLNVWRLAIWYSAGSYAVAEWYIFSTFTLNYEGQGAQPVKKLGPRAWLGLLVVATEVCVIVKHGKGMFTAPFPWYVKLGWAIIFSVLFFGSAIYFTFFNTPERESSERRDQEKNILETAELYSVTVPQQHFRTIAAVYFAVAALHFATAILRFDGPTVAYRQLKATWRRSKRRVVGSTSRDLAARSRGVVSPEPLADRTASTQLRWVTSSALRSASTVLSAFNVTDRHFDTTHLVRELLETALLTYQAYKTSFLVAQPWMNHAVVSLLLLNCWLGPLLSHFSSRTTVTQARLLVLFANIALDLTSYAVLPIALFLPYYSDFDAASGGFDTRFWYTDRWLVRMMNEWRMLFVTSVWDGLARLVIALSIAGSLHSRLGHRVLALWGALVLAVHVHAMSHAAPRMCITELRPWLSARATCSLLEINCAALGVSGVADDLDESFRLIDTRWVSLLILRHCPRIEISASIQGFHGLMGLKTYNATLARWDADGALTKRSNPRMLFVFLVATNMTEMPRGLYEPRANFPPQLLDVEICRSNLTTLPMALADSWLGGLFLLFEETQFREVPPVLAALDVRSLSLAMNAFTTMPASVLEGSRINWLQLNGSPITQFPPDLRSPPPLLWLKIRGTQLSELPPWMPRRQRGSLGLGGGVA